VKPALLRTLLILGITSTAVHYTDNAVSIEKYPQPSWINEPIIFAVWIGFTAMGIAGYVLYRQGRTWPALALLTIYSYTGLSTPLHYRYGSLSGLSWWQQLFVWTDGLTGAAILAFVLWAALKTRAPARRPA
jgi:hypothetical protein